MFKKAGKNPENENKRVFILGDSIVKHGSCYPHIPSHQKL